MKPYFTDSAVEIYCGDCREILPTLDKAAQDPHYVCTANHTPFPRDCWDSHAREQPPEKVQGRIKTDKQ